MDAIAPDPEDYDDVEFQPPPPPPPPPPPASGQEEPEESGQEEPEESGQEEPEESSVCPPPVLEEEPRESTLYAEAEWQEGGDESDHSSEVDEEDLNIAIPKPQEEVTLDDALANVDAVTSHILDPNHTPLIEAPTYALYYHANTNTQFKDRGGYNNGLGKFSEEAAMQEQLLELLSEAHQYAVLLYTWRSCSLGVPPIKSHDQPNRMDIYETTIQVMETQIAKLRKLLKFQEKSISKFCEAVKRYIESKETFVSEAYLLTLAKFLNMFAVLDELKNIKASVKNDYATYRRATEITRKHIEEGSLMESQQLSMFLGTYNSFRTTLEKHLANNIPAHSDLLIDIVNSCLSMYENNQYLLPEDKHMLLKVIGYGLHLIDRPDLNINKLEGKRKINISKIDKIFAKIEVVPLFGDMMISPFNLIQGMPNFDETKWPHCKEMLTGDQKVNIPHHLQGMRKQHNLLLCQLAQKDCRKQQLVREHNSGKSGEDVSRELYDLALHTLQQLSDWTATITELFSWKLQHPTNPKDNPECPQDAEEYERATRYNYNREEKCAMTEMIALVKGVQKKVDAMSPQFIGAIHKHIYITLQEFVQSQLREPLRKAFKHKRHIIKSILIAIRDTCADWLRGEEPANDPITQGKKDSETGFKVEIPKRNIPPSYTQLYMLRSMMESLVDKSAGKKAPRKDIDSHHIQAIENFLKVTFHWPHLINFSETLKKCCDLSQFWYREFYLEMTLGKRIQFPIDMSMPWILTDHILDNKDPTLMDYMLYPLDLYNDSAECALYSFKKQFLYEELEAEVNLCFDQLVYKLSEQVFSYYKHLAAAIYLDKTLKNKCQKQNYVITPPPLARYQSILKQEQVKILGREIDLNKLVSQRMNEALHKSLDVALNRFEEGDITGVMELEGLVEINRLTHKLLSEYMDLDDFDAMFEEANWSVTHPCGRIPLYIFLELNHDFFPHYCYNSSTNRFVKTVFPFAEVKERKGKSSNISQAYLWGTKSLAMCYNAMYDQYSNFVGPPHFATIIRLLGYQDVAVILKEILECIRKICKYTILPYMKALTEVLPKRIILPRWEYGSIGALPYYQAQLNDIMMYSDLQPKVFHGLRELGNAVLFCMSLTQALAQNESGEIKQSALFLSVIRKPYVSKKKKVPTATLR